MLIGGVIGAAYRYYQGGSGGLPGVYTVIVTIAVGCLWRYFLVKFRIEFKWYLHYVFALSLELSILGLLYVALPDGKGPIVVRMIAGPLLVLFPLVSTVLSLLFQHHWDKKIVAFRWSPDHELAPAATQVRIRQTSIRSLILSLLIVASLITLTLMQHTNSTALVESERNRFVVNQLIVTVHRGANEQARLARSYAAIEEQEQLKRYQDVRRHNDDHLGITIASELDIPSADGVQNFVVLPGGGRVTRDEYVLLQRSQEQRLLQEQQELDAIAVADSGDREGAIRLLDSAQYIEVRENH